jgi:hypothetical protein
MNEILPLPIIYNFSFSVKDFVYMQYFRNNSSEPGFELNLSTNTNTILPQNAYNYTISNNKSITYPSGNSVTIDNGGLYNHNIIIYGYSKTPANGMLTVDIVNDKFESVSLTARAIKNITPISAEPLILSVSVTHNSGDIIQLRLQGCDVSSLQNNIDCFITSVTWSINGV